MPLSKFGSRVVHKGEVEDKIVADHQYDLRLRDVSPERPQHFGRLEPTPFHQPLLLPFTDAKVDVDYMEEYIFWCFTGGLNRYMFV